MSEILKISGKKFKLPRPERLSWSVRPGGWLLVVHGDGRRERVSLHEARGVFSASIGGRLHCGAILSEGRSGGGGAGGDSDLVAQFPGKVRKILAPAGTKVREGDALVLVEAMKMEFTVKAPADGCVTKVLVEEGCQISPGDRFLDFEAFGSDD